MRGLIASAFALFAILSWAAPGLTLEKSPRVFDGDDLDEWNASRSYSVTYYNICTGWVWIWSGFADGQVLGTVFDSGCSSRCPSGIDYSYLYYWTGAIPGYGFTGTHAIHLVDEDGCPSGGALASQAWLPVSGWNLTFWNTWYLPRHFLIQTTLQDDLGLGSPVALPSDGWHACGVCYPTTRTTNSYFYGLETSPVCPGSPLFDGSCHVEWLAMVGVFCASSVEDESWGAIKSLYR